MNEDQRRFTQAFYHFYNPENGLPLTGLAGDTSPNWALEDTKDFGPDQPFSYDKAKQYFYAAREYLYLAVTDRDYEQRRRNYSYSLLFRSLGHVVHMLQDMSQPQHVRDDAHLPTTWFSWHGQSAFEAYMDESFLNGGTSANLLALLATYLGNKPTMAQKFVDARMFWITDPSGDAPADLGIEGMGLSQ